MAGIANAHVEANLPNPTVSSAVNRAIDGCKRICPTVSDRRLPITLDLMRHLKDSIRLTAVSHYEQRLIWCIFTTAFFAALRVSEFVSPSPSKYDERSTLLISDILENDPSMTLTIRQSKTDQFGHGYRIALHATGRSVCPVTALRNYIAARKSSNLHALPLFVQENGQFVTRTHVDRWLLTHLRGIPEKHRYGTHSFRIGAASTAASHGASEATIQRIGRWKSSCYARYVRTAVPTHALDAYGQSSGLG
ncbi:uncharacterized protein LOC129589976 [Paramacrobiotus metropolitanus]|uniref:uncharacterized protein LOC129589976 n=1 Tax=Paramacrobiotus metropolitanus TaxID=2943436 RepID=UPI002445FA4B|nr:uncharacterized protein LOC129589976 [Paramacrobiotus metropolitanus]